MQSVQDPSYVSTQKDIFIGDFTPLTSAQKFTNTNGVTSAELGLRGVSSKEFVLRTYGFQTAADNEKRAIDIVLNSGSGSTNPIVFGPGSSTSIGPDEIVTNQIVAKKVITTPELSIVPDYVFSPEYQRISMDSLERFLHLNKHLPSVPSQQEIGQSGLDIEKTILGLLKNLEVQSLQMIEQEKRIQALEKEIKAIR